MPAWLEIILRSLSLLIALFFITKWLGKKQLAQLSIFDLISGIVLGGIVAIHSSTLSSPITYGLLAISVWFLIPYLTDYISIKNKTFRTIVQGDSTVIIQDGKIKEDNLKKERYSTDDLLENLRTKDVFQVSDVEYAILEPSGLLNVLLKEEHKPLSAKDLGIIIPQKKEPHAVIMDGNMLLGPLATMGLNPNWLETELEKINVSIDNVFLGQVDSDGQLTVDLYDDKIVVPQPTEKPLLLATLKKCQADLELFSLETENEQSKKLYVENSKKVQQVIDLISSHLK